MTVFDPVQRIKQTLFDTIDEFPGVGFQRNVLRPLGTIIFAFDAINSPALLNKSKVMESREGTFRIIDKESSLSFD